jgi:hypothetical protein
MEPRKGFFLDTYGLLSINIVASYSNSVVIGPDGGA